MAPRNITAWRRISEDFILDNHCQEKSNFFLLYSSYSFYSVVSKHILGLCVYPTCINHEQQHYKFLKLHFYIFTWEER